MHDYTQFDRNVIHQEWFTSMTFPYGQLMVWLWLRADNIGVYDINLKDFCENHMGSFLEPSDISIDEFVKQCNADGKKRIIVLDEGRRLWFAPTVIFKHGTKDGIRTLNKGDRDASLLQRLAARPETRRWVIAEIKKKSRLFIDKELLHKVVLWSSSNEIAKKFARDIAKAIGYKIPVSKELPERIKADFGGQCAYCGGTFDAVLLEIDHIKPISQKGPDKHFNKVPACEECNQKKGVNSVFEFMKNSEYDWRPALQNKVDYLIKKGHLDYPRYYPYKRNKKEKFINRYDAGYEKRIENKYGTSILPKYWAHLKSLGWKKVHGPAGTVWHAPKNDQQ